MKQSLTFLLSLFTYASFAQSVGIGTTTPNASAQLEVSSTSRGLLIPRLTEVQRTAISNPAQGLMVYQTDGTAGFYVNRSTLPSTPNWSLVTEGTNYWIKANGVNDINNSNTGRTGIGTNVPVTKLHVSTTDSGIAVLENTQTLATDIDAGLFFKTGPILNSYYTGAIKTTGTSANTSRLGFYTLANSSANALVERMSILDGGNIGIGTSTPTAKLEINGQVKISGGSPGVGKLLETDATGLASWVDKSSSFLPAGVSGNTLRNTGLAWVATSNLFNNGINIGIGTTSPTEKLTIQTASNVLGFTQTDGTASLSTYVGTPISGSLGGWIGTKSNHPLYFFTNNSSPTATLLQNGNMGIGTMTPAEKLTVQTATNSLGITHTDGTIRIGSFIGGAGVGGYFGTVSNHPLYFMTNNGAAQVALLQSGSFGIGTASPSATLHVIRGTGANGTAQFDGSVNSSHFNYSTTEETYIRGGKATSAVYLNDASAGNVILANGGGKVGIGTGVPTAPLSFANTVGNKISLFGDAATAHYGIGVQGGYLQIYGNSTAADIVLGYGKSDAFTENARFWGTGDMHLGKYTTWATTADNRKLTFGDGEFAYIGEAGADDRLELNGGSFSFKTGDVYIGATDFTKGAGYKLRVNGKIISEEVRVQLAAAWPDYVFENGYKRLSLPDVETFVNTNKHLPGIPSAKEIDSDGQHLGEIQRRLLEKIEELTLYIIEQDKRIKKLENK